MRTKANLIKDNLYVIELKDEMVTRLIVTHKDYSLSYELLTMYNDDLKNNSFDIKSYIKNLNYENLIDYLQEINDMEDDCLYHERLIDDLLVKDSEDEK